MNVFNGHSHTIFINSEDLLLFYSTCKCLYFVLLVPVRLNGADVDYGGIVEVFYNGKWGRICRNKWDLNDVEVVCKQLGFKSAFAEFIGSGVKDEDIPFLMSGVSCTGYESDLASCKRSDGEYQCQDDKGAQALCEPSKLLIKCN